MSNNIEMGEVEKLDEGSEPLAVVEDPLPRPSVHAAVHYAAFLRRESHRQQEPKAAALRNAAVMIDLLNAESNRLHRELIDAQGREAEQQDAVDVWSIAKSVGGQVVPAYGDRGNPMLLYPDQVDAFADAIASRQPMATGMRAAPACANMPADKLATWQADGEEHCIQVREVYAVEWTAEGVDREVARIGDMDPKIALRVGLDGDGDVYLSTTGQPGQGIEFCTAGSGGGKSPHTHKALRALMHAIQADNIADPRRDWRALRNSKKAEGKGIDNG